MITTDGKGSQPGLHQRWPQRAIVDSTEFRGLLRCNNLVVERAEPGAAARVRLAALAPIAVPARVAAGLAGLIAASGALAIAAGPGRATTYAGISAAGAVLTAGAGVGLIAAGAVIGLGRRSRRRAGDLAVLAGLTWYAAVWVAWQDGPPLIPSIAMVAAGFALPLIVHLAVAYPTGRVSSQPARVLVGATYAEAAVVGCALALFRDPYSDPGCLANCNVNAFLVRSLPSLSRAVEISDRWFTATAALALSAVCAVRLTRASTAARTRLVPVFGPRWSSAPLWPHVQPCFRPSRSRTRSTPPCSRSSPSPVAPSCCWRLASYPLWPAREPSAGRSRGSPPTSARRRPRERCDPPSPRR